ncbi:LCP family protein [Polymorphospora rubra]|uniref:Transcriptional regulator n=1 Tax=Polymorphospora rubra TaxID=338584 RepID=A0A810N030_9ACTN|nr:transcriptional regulator [Polymorphospora rubra]
MVTRVGRRPEGGDAPSKPRSRIPRWARLCTFFGAVLMLLSGGVLVATEILLARYEGAVGSGDLFGDQAAGAQERRSDITGPLNLLLVGIDPRPSDPNRPPLADSILVLHVNENLDGAYLFSLPRDLIVDIPRFDKAGYRGGQGRLNSAMERGSRVPGQEVPSAVQGFELLSQTISARTGITRFDAGAIINFTGFQKIVDAMGGVEMYIDTDVKSEHREPDGRHRKGNPNGEGYIGPQAEYKKGMAHLEGWQALDYVRQRYTLPDGDYGRQRHQQQFIRAMVDQAFSADVVTNPVKLDAVLRAAGESVIFSGRGNSVVDFGLALRNLRSNSITMMKLPGGGVGTGDNYQGERLEPVAEEFFAALKAGTVDDFVIGHPELINK